MYQICQTLPNLSNTQNAAKVSPCVGQHVDYFLILVDCHIELFTSHSELLPDSLRSFPDCVSTASRKKEECHRMSNVTDCLRLWSGAEVRKYCGLSEEMLQNES